ATLGALQVDMAEEITPVLRRKDLLDLFDTMPDLSGNDLDVGQFIRSGDDLDLTVAWRRFDAEPDAGQAVPSRDERCPVPVVEFRRLLKDGRLKAWRFDHIGGSWEPCTHRDVRPGMVTIVSADAGCYDPRLGWNPESREAVDEISPPIADLDAFLD